MTSCITMTVIWTDGTVHQGTAGARRSDARRHDSPPPVTGSIYAILTVGSRRQGCSFVFSCGGLSPHNLGQKRPEFLNFNEKLCQIRGEI